MTKLRLALGAFAAIVVGAVAVAQGIGGTGAFQGWPIVGQSSYCMTTTNGVCTVTVPAGPNSLTGQETIPANTGLGNRAPANVLLSPANLHANPITFVTVTVSGNPSNISASNLDGGVVYNYATAAAITAANISLPSSPVHGQQYVISANRNITTLTVGPATGDTIAENTRPTVLTANTTGGPQGYRFVCNKPSGSACTWLRLQ